MPTRTRSFRILPLAAAASIAAVGLAACDDDPFGLGDWVANPDSVLLYSLARPELNLPSALNAYLKRTLRVEAPTSSGEWDVALDTQDGQLVLLPAVALGIPGEARIATFPGMDFEELLVAPVDTVPYTAEAVPVVMSTTYVVRTNSYPTGFGRSCFYYAKLQPFEIDLQAETVRFIIDSNPICQQPDLVPPRR